MAVNFATLLYEPAFDMFAVPIIIYPYASQPTAAGYAARGIFDTRAIDVIGEDGSVYSEQKTILDILEKEFPILPIQGDRVDIPFDCNGAPVGMMEILDADTNGGGETTLALRQWLA